MYFVGAVACLALPLAALCAQTQDAPEGKPAPAAKESAWPIVAPKKDWYDEKRLATLVAALRPVVEKHAQLKFLREPTVLVASDESWAKLIAEEMPRARDQDLAQAITFALYVPAHDSVVLSPFLGYHLLQREADDAGPQLGDQLHGDYDDIKKKPNVQPLLVHELVHALQEQHFHLPSRMKAAANGDAKVVLRSMVEGFATWVEERAASADYGIANYAFTNERTNRRNARMEYVRGRDFFARLHERGGIEAVHDAMRNEPLPLPEFARIAISKPSSAANELPANAGNAKTGGK
jgi:hypothetical protein